MAAPSTSGRSRSGASRAGVGAKSAFINSATNSSSRSSSSRRPVGSSSSSLSIAAVDDEMPSSYGRRAGISTFVSSSSVSGSFGDEVPIRGGGSVGDEHLLMSSSSSSLQSPLLGQELSAGQQQSLREIERTAREDEPNLFDFPAGVHPVYRPLPLVLKIAIALLSLVIVGRFGGRLARNLAQGIRTAMVSSPSSWSPRSWGTAIKKSISLWVSSFDVLAMRRRSIMFLFKWIILSTVLGLSIQELFYAPSRVTTQYLNENGLLPSRLSSYQIVSPFFPQNNEAAPQLLPTPIGVHSIQYFQNSGSSSASINPHFPNKNAFNTKTRFNAIDAIYLHHGFGASSLSYLPVLPSLVQRLGARVGIAHDCPGFGFTDRPDADADASTHTSMRDLAKEPSGQLEGQMQEGLDENEGITLSGLQQYSFENNVGIGISLLENVVSSLPPEAATPCTPGFSTDNSIETTDVLNSSNSQTVKKKLAIVGHSMGAKSALRMALAYNAPLSNIDNTQPKRPDEGWKPELVILIAPALEGIALPPPKQHVASRALNEVAEVVKRNDGGKVNGISRTAIDKLKRSLRVFYIFWRKIFLDYPFQYGLRRVVGRKGFWRSGLSLAWGDPQRLSDSDVLRFQWPSVGKGWERGLLNFARSRLSPPIHHTNDDSQLLNELVNRKDIEVIIMYGSKDRVISIEGRVAEELKRNYPTIKLVRLEGMGHDPFEEDVEMFLEELTKALNS